ncbi:SDR family NAD(P)-dependent oxidoreductase [Deinococcus peraridilitoris]|uniref:Ketoreductase domain-containing protein n=1 Tax=Deinococcus peraridilitoris (strain DSM 19664 / LMG 22246 / CIP 109416 / KR-200) TaxID=937777 RepID=K9ZW23_DEIPD|nr:SDR family NAD(P)-dependent oxidoreductase [Deinococcus peraridilitoris]AFZ65761.1 short-chain dehydrogenase of unknown substrate specificity [Deinococcus peraridilitoris DSM 19664]
MTSPRLSGPPSASLHVIVTGASSGLGRAIARDLHGRGHRLVLAARRAEQLEALAAELSPAGHRVLAVPTDVGDPESRAALIQRAQAVFGPLDVLVNNAGVGGSRGQTFWELPLQEATVDINLLALIDLTHQTLPGMVERGRGHIINVASVAGLIATEPLYSASKFGVRGFSLAVRRQLLGTGVHVSLVSPGFVRSEMTADVRFPLPGPETVAHAVAGLLQRPRREVVVPGAYRALVALERAWPRLGDLLVRQIMAQRRAPR